MFSFSKKRKGNKLLVKTHSYKYLEDFGLKRGDQVYLYYQCVYGDISGDNRGPVAASVLSLSPILRVNAMWVHKDLKVKCHVADTEAKKRKGLQGFEKLEAGEGMYFPYLPEGESVSFHQGSVPFGLDLIFLKDDEIVRIEADTKVGSSERWHCKDCSGVIEVQAGFCFENDVNVGDRIALFSVSERDVPTLDRERKLEATETESYSDDRYYFMPNAVNLVSQIADGL